MRTSTAVFLLFPLALVAAGCEVTKTANPLSPSVAGPIPGVNITAPSLLEPRPGADIAVDQQPVTLLIENAASTGQRALSYAFEVATDADFTNKVFTREGVEPGSGGRTSLRLPDPLATARTYYWRVKAKDGANEGPFSAVGYFDVFTPIVIQQPVAVAPANNVQTDKLNPRFTIGNAPRSGPVGPISYVVEVSENSAFAPRLAVWTVPEQPNQTHLDAPQDLPPGRQFFWRVLAHDQTTTGPWSQIQVFRTPAPIAPPPPPPPSGGGGGGGDIGACGPPYPNNGPAIISCVSAKYPERLAAGVSLAQRQDNMRFLRDRVIETGICGGLDLGWNLKRGGPELSIDAIVQRQGGSDTILDIGLAYDDTSRPLQLQWVVSSYPFYATYSPRPSCK